VRLSNPSRLFTGPERTGPYPTQFTRRPAESSLVVLLASSRPPDLDQLAAGWPSTRLSEDACSTMIKWRFSKTTKKTSASEDY